MKKLIIAGFLSLALLPLGAFAEFSVSGVTFSIPGSAKAEVLPGVKEPVPPTTDIDEIVQLNNLTIQNISGNELPAVIYASRDVGSVCKSYESLDATVSVVRPCSLAPAMLYSIRVQEDSRILLRNRSRGALSDFSAGDRINVYGFLGDGKNEIEALIVRNLDKPVSYKNIQLNNVEIISGPVFSGYDASGRELFLLGGARFPVEIVVAKRFPTPCLGFGAESKSGSIVPCPMFESKIQPGQSSAEAAPMRYPFTTYTIVLGEKTSVLNRVRKNISISDLAVGHVVNVYGRANSTNGKIEAEVVRDISLPANGAGTLRVQAVDDGIVCITTPCGVLTGAKVILSEANGRFVGSRTTEKGEAIFEGVPAGSYIVNVEAKGYKAAKREIVLSEGGTESVIVPLSRTAQEKALNVLYPNGGESFVRGSGVVIQWTARTLTTAPITFDIFLVSYGERERVYTIARGLPFNPSQKAESFAWDVPQTLEKILLSDGSYFIRICASGHCSEGSSLQDQSDGPFRVTTKTEGVPVKIKKLNPEKGPFGATVVISGEGFTKTGNTIYFGDGNHVLTVGESDGSTLSFVVPQTASSCNLSRPDVSADVSVSSGAEKAMLGVTTPASTVNPPCARLRYQLPEGRYMIWVINENGTSNLVPFVLTNILVQPMIIRDLPQYERSEPIPSLLPRGVQIMPFMQTKNAPL
ncbi:MAG: carboxypeptidase regulatory-like domain-containing protein [Patescibacteria group bacterium]